MSFTVLPAHPNAIDMGKINEVFSTQEYSVWPSTWSRVGTSDQWTSTAYGQSIPAYDADTWVLFQDNSRFKISSYSYTPGSYGPSTETITITATPGWVPVSITNGPQQVSLIVKYSPSFNLSNYYAGAGRVLGPNNTTGKPNNVTTYVPSSGQLSYGNFHSAYRPLLVDIIMVGGGGGGGATTGWEGGGGGGGGGVVYAKNVLLSASNHSYPVVVGAGGSAQTKGNDTTFLNMTAYGGGAGGYNPTTGHTGQNGGCGGGGRGTNGSYPGGSSIQTSPVGLVLPTYGGSYGFPGGYGNVDSSGAGGGGAGGAGAAGSYYNTAASAGGAGYLFSLWEELWPGLTPMSFTLGVGGGGGGFNRYGTGSCGVRGTDYGAGGAGQASVGTWYSNGRNGAVIISYYGASYYGGNQRASGGATYTCGDGKIYHVFSSSGNFIVY